MTTRSFYIVDDDDVVRASLQSLMSTQSDLIIRGFRSGDVFLAAMHTLDPGCILLDLHMPGISGIEVLKALAASSARFATVVLTGQGDVTLAVQAMKAGAVDFLEKPCIPNDLFGAVEVGFARLAQQGLETARVEQAQAKLAILSPRELDVLRGLTMGRANKVIAYELDISPRTVEIYRAKLMEKLEVRSLSEALRIAFTAGISETG